MSYRATLAREPATSAMYGRHLLNQQRDSFISKRATAQNGPQAQQSGRAKRKTGCYELLTLRTTSTEMDDHANSRVELNGVAFLSEMDGRGAGKRPLSGTERAATNRSFHSFESPAIALRGWAWR